MSLYRLMHRGHVIALHLFVLLVVISLTACRNGPVTIVLPTRLPTHPMMGSSVAPT